MSAADRIRRFRRDEEAGPLLEFTLVAGIFFATMFGVVEFAYFMWQFNAVSKGAEIALRYAVVSDPVTRSSATLTPNSGVVITCQLNASGTTATCSTGNANSAAMKCIVDRLRAYAPFVRYNNVVITYSANALGFAGFTAPTVQIGLQNLSFPSVFMRYLGTRLLPALNYTMTAEDMNSQAPPSNPDTNTTTCG